MIARLVLTLAVLVLALVPCAHREDINQAGSNCGSYYFLDPGDGVPSAVLHGTEGDVYVVNQERSVLDPQISGTASARVPSLRRGGLSGSDEVLLMPDQHERLADAVAGKGVIGPGGLILVAGTITYAYEEAVLWIVDGQQLASYSVHAILDSPSSRLTGVFEVSSSHFVVTGERDFEGSWSTFAAPIDLSRPDQPKVGSVVELTADDRFGLVDPMSMAIIDDKMFMWSFPATDFDQLLESPVLRWSSADGILWSQESPASLESLVDGTIAIEWAQMGSGATPL